MPSTISNKSTHIFNCTTRSRYALSILWSMTVFHITPCPILAVHMFQCNIVDIFSQTSFPPRWEWQPWPQTSTHPIHCSVASRRQVSSRPQ